MTQETKMQDPMEFLKSMWGGMGFSLPGMVTPTLDADELGKRIADLKAVEGWLKTNLGMLQLTIQGLEVQRATISAIQAFGQSVQQAGASADIADPAAANPFLSAALNPALWPWNIMQPPTGASNTADVAAAAQTKEPPAKPGRKRKA
jgi:hypothetical protein